MSDGLTLPPKEFVRSSCACTACTAYCMRHPGMLIPSDLLRIADHLVATGRTKATFEVMDYLWASVGALIGNRATGETRRVGTITPAMENKRCVFLTEDNRCSIHAVAPFGCAYFDSHEAAVDADVKSLWAHRLIANTPAYEQARQVLIKRDGGEHQYIR